MRASRALVATGVLTGLLAATAGISEAAGGQAPPSVYIDKGACPFECCTYREWTAQSDIALLDRPDGKQYVGRIKKGSKVLALTGEVHSAPRRVILTKDDQDAGVKAGEVIYVLHYIGEGSWKAWHKGKIIEIGDLPGTGWKPEITWWVKLKSPSGVIGWTVERGNFANVDACG